jgi:hypothetical protein
VAGADVYRIVGCLVDDDKRAMIQLVQLDLLLDRLDRLETQLKGCHDDIRVLTKTIASQAKTAADSALKTKVRFDQLVSEWKSFETPSSSAMDLAMHPAYQQIIGMGPIAITWIVSELEKEPDHWFWALHCLSGGVDPVSPPNRGDLDAMAAAWIKWAKENGY